MENQLLLRVYEKRNKFRYLVRKPPSPKNTVLRYVSSCVINRFNGYDILKISKKDCVKPTFSPLYIVYDPVGDATKNIECYFNAFCLKYSRGNRSRDNKQRIDKVHPYEFFSCNKFNATKKGHDSRVAMKLSCQLA